jgi:predicted transglutaminase-like cysteine proteinase
MRLHRTARVLALATMIAVSGFATVSQASFFGLPLPLKFQIDHLNFNTPVLAPMAHTRFCLRYQADCEIRGVDFRRRNIALTEERWNELTTLNRQVNRDIRPQLNEGGVLTEEWLVAPRAGECHDYAVTKRHELLTRGWPSRSLLLSEVIAASGEHHLVLIVRTKDVDLVLDNLSANMRPISMTRYQWVRVESPSNPKYWSTLSVPSHLRMATLADQRALRLDRSASALPEGEPQNRRSDYADGGPQQTGVHE